MESRTIDLGGPVYYLEFPGPSRGPTFVLVHGLGGSHANWLAIAPILAQRGRVLALDLPGFGLSPLAGRKATMRSSRSIINEFIQGVSSAPVVLIGNSMGGALSIAQAVANPDSVRGLVLIAPALPRNGLHSVDTTVAGFISAAIVPTVGGRLIGGRLIVNALRQYGAARMVQRMLALCTVDPSRVPPEIVDAHLEVAKQRAFEMDVPAAFLQQTRSLVGTLGRRRRYLDLLRQVCAPTLLIGGACDRLVPRASVEAISHIRPDWDHVMLDDCGHVPMLEHPRVVANAIDAWLSGPASWILQGKRSLAGAALAI
jgi:pimeloyl-ACP methyl ester carboxylesterase